MKLNFEYFLFESLKHARKIAITCLLLIITSNLLLSQTKGNFGLSQAQPSFTLPVGLGKIDIAIRKKKIVPNAQLIKINKTYYLLNNGWELAESDKVIGNNQSIFNLNFNTKNWYNATVPGTVLTTLVNQGICPDPYIGLNNLAISDSLCRKDWWYRIAFATPKEALDKISWLQFDGINYKAQVWLNGKIVGNINGAFARGNFNVSKLLNRNGKNILAIRILPPPNPGIPHEQSGITGAGPNGGVLCLDGPTFIASEGWDWMPGIRDRNIGIWQNVHLRLTGAITLKDPQIITDLPLPDTTSAKLTVKAFVTNNSDKIKNCLVKGQIDNINFSQKILLKPREQKLVIFSTENTPVLNIKHPALWWPNGYGNPNLYQLKLSVLDDLQEVSDFQNVRFGIREMSYELMVDAPNKKEWRVSYQPTNVIKGKPLFDNINRVKVDGGFYIPSLFKDVNVKAFESLPETKNPYLVIKVNGQKIFCKGGDWGIDDAMKRVERSRLEPAFKLHKEANFNMIRNWTGECTEEIFFELADEYGMLVWNDFWMSTEGYNLNPIDDQLTLDNITEVVKRFRNHPSIAIWCPRNEGYAPESIENKIATIIASEDGTRHYNGNSREMNLRQSGRWLYLDNQADYYTKYAEGFSTEIGTFSIPVTSTLKKFIKKEDLWPINDVWHYHDLHTSENANLKGYLRAADSLYGKPTGLEDFNKKIQLINYESHRNIFEAWNSKIWKNASGVLLWMTHPAWPSMIWQTYSWDYETHGSYYGAQKACEPLHIQMNLIDNKIIAINTSLISYSNLSAKMKIFGLDGIEIYKKEKPIALGINESVEVFIPDLSSIQLPPVYLVKLFIVNKDRQVIAENSYWKTNAVTKDFTAFNQLGVVKLVAKNVVVDKGKMVFWIENNTSTPAIGIKLNLMDDQSNIVLPAYFSDGYFTLLPGEKKAITVKYDANIKATRVKADGYNINNDIILIK